MNRKQYKIISVVIFVFMIFLVFGQFRNTQIQNNGIRTVATVVAVNVREVREHPDEIRHDVTFEYEARGQIVTATRTYTYERSFRGGWRIGEEVEIYFDDNNPTNFMFANESSGFGVMFWVQMVAFSGVL